MIQYQYVNAIDKYHPYQSATKICTGGQGNDKSRGQGNDKSRDQGNDKLLKKRGSQLKKDTEFKVNLLKVSNGNDYFSFH